MKVCKSIMQQDCRSAGCMEAKMARLMALGIVTFLLTCLGLAQQVTGTYRIQIEDELGIGVFDEPQMSARVVVTPDGNIVAPFAGTLRAEGKTTAELETELADIYTQKLKLKNPKVTITILKVRRILASVSGAVERGGQFEMRPGMTVRDLITLGGVRDDIGDLRKAMFKRKSWVETIPLDLYSMVIYGNLAQDYAIQDGDQITIPPKKGMFIDIFGEVNRPTSVAYVDNLTLISALNSAGGPILSRARKSRILVIRRKEGNPDAYYMIVCDLAAYEGKKDFAQNIKMMPGDTVVVPNNGNPNFELVNSVANFLFILDRFGIKFLNRD